MRSQSESEGEVIGAHLRVVVTETGEHCLLGESGRATFKLSVVLLGACDFFRDEKMRARCLNKSTLSLDLCMMCGRRGFPSFLGGTPG